MNVNKMKPTIFFVSLISLCCAVSFARNTDLADSVQKTKLAKSSNLRLITRVHSLGLFYYGGRIVSNNPVVDFNVNYDRKKWGFQIFKALDLNDSGTPINFTLAVLNKNFHFGKRLTITPSAGFILEQSRTIADHGSDAALIVVTAFKLSRVVTLEHSTLFGNLLLEPELRDWVNRLRLLYSKNHLDFILMCWHNNKVFDSAEYVTVGFSAFYSRIKLGQTVSMNVGLTGLVMPYYSDSVANPLKNGLVLTVVMVLD